MVGKRLEAEIVVIEGVKFPINNLGELEAAMRCHPFPMYFLGMSPAEVKQVPSYQPK